MLANCCRANWSWQEHAWKQGNHLGASTAAVPEGGDRGLDQADVVETDSKGDGWCVPLSIAVDPPEEILKVSHQVPVTFLL